MSVREERIKESNKIFNELTILRMEKDKVDVKIKKKEEELRKICPCDTREGYGISICTKCGETH